MGQLLGRLPTVLCTAETVNRTLTPIVTTNIMTQLSGQIVPKETEMRIANRCIMAAVVSLALIMASDAWAARPGSRLVSLRLHMLDKEVTIDDASGKAIHKFKLTDAMTV